MTQIKLNSKWCSINSTFIVTDIVEKNNVTWIYYKNNLTNQQYHCYKESFVYRFTENVN